jgi:hypothetical protein
MLVTYLFATPGDSDLQKDKKVLDIHSQFPHIFSWLNFCFWKTIVIPLNTY